MVFLVILFLNMLLGSATFYFASFWFTSNKILSDVDTETAELLVNMSLEEPSWWVWVTEDMVPGNLEERSGIDNDNYVIVSEEYVADAVANFMARCVVSNSKAQVQGNW